MQQVMYLYKVTVITPGYFCTSTFEALARTFTCIAPNV